MPNLNVQKFARKFEDKLKKIKVCLFDVDGILTDGRIFYQDDKISYNRFFHVHDGYGIRLLIENGVKVGFISGGKSDSVSKRAENLQIDYLYLGSEDKREAFLDIESKAGVKAEEILYMGDEFFDIPLLRRAGFSATNATASLEVQNAVDYVTEREAGKGCVREVIDMVRFIQGIAPSIPDFE